MLVGVSGGNPCIRMSVAAEGAMAVFCIGIALVEERVSDLTHVVPDKLYAWVAVVGAE